MSDAFQDLRIKRVSTADQVASLIRERILRGEFKPGMPLREVSLAGSIGVSRNTLREALRILVQEGLVRHHVHRGIAVTELEADDVRDIYRVRRLLEVMAIESVRPDESTLRQLGDAVDQLEAAAEAQDWQALVEADMRFHGLLVGLLGSERLDTFFTNLVSELRLGLMMVDRASGDLRRLSAEHRKVVELMAAGKRKEGARALDAHLADAENLVRAVAGAPAEGGGS